MFHRVMADRPAAFGLPRCYRLRGTALTPSELDQILGRLQRVLPLAAVERALEQKVVLPPGDVLTFDDGYREHLDLVAPRLVERGLIATFYVATGLHGDGDAVAPVDAWYWLLDHARRRIGRVPLPGGEWFQDRLDTLAGKQVWVGGPPKAAFLAASPAHQDVMLGALADSADTELPQDLAARLYLKPDEWVSLTALGMQLGAHSVTHPRLTQVDPVTVRTEIAQSVAAIPTAGGPVPFAYPDGAFDDLVVEAAKQVGVSSGVTCRPGSIRPGDDRLKLPRVFVTPAGADR